MSDDDIPPSDPDEDLPVTTRDLMEAITAAAGVPMLEPTVGSTEPAEFYRSVARALGVSETDADGRRLTKPMLAHAIVEAAGLRWDRAWDGSLTPSGGGGSVSNEGLRQMLRATRLLAGGRTTTAGAPGQPWTDEEIGATLDAYVDLLLGELQGEPLVKRQVVAALVQRLPARTRGAVQYKLRNISAILYEEGLPWVDGYKPASDYQASLRRAVLLRLDGAEGLRSALERLAQRADPGSFAGSYGDREVPKPEASPATRRSEPGTMVTSGWGGAARDAANRRLGDQGEQWVVRLEQENLREAGRDDLAERVEQVSKSRGDGLGYDVLTFTGAGAERWVEVKTTNSGRSAPFRITRNELAVWRANVERYELVRLFNFTGDPRFYRLTGSPDEQLDLEAVVWDARPR